MNNFKKENNPNYKHGKYCSKNYCLNCSKDISSLAKRCGHCANIVKMKKIWKMKRTKRKIPKCIDCNKRITFNRKRCRKCNIKFWRGKNHHNWIDGRKQKPYPSFFNNNLKEEIRKRDNYICKNCGMTDEEHIIVLGYHLTIHHIDYNKMNCNDKNLITLCNQCNIRANSNRILWKLKYKSLISSLVRK